MKIEIENLMKRLTSKAPTFNCMVEWEYIKPHKIKTGRIINVTETYFNVFFDGNSGANKISKNRKLKIIGHQILLSDVLAAMNLFNSGYDPDVDTAGHTVYLWQKLGLQKSLQEIYAECEWVQVFYSSKNCGIEKEKDGECTCGKRQPKQELHRELFTLLLNEIHA